ncbi:MAG: hypothetical protein PHX54_10350 [Lentimicrobiaceae bacterium]|nr:hypothetical protein [Lentimicrobiaceae bacterium]
MNPIISIKIIILGAAIILISMPSQSQVKPEVTIGLKFNSEILITTTHDNHPPALEVGGGINLNEKWYTGINANYFKTKSSITEAKHFLIEIELRRSFGFNAIPKIKLDLSLRPGYFLVDAYSLSTSTDLDLFKTIAISLNTGISYFISNDIKFSVRPGLTCLPQEKSPQTDKQRIGAICEANFSYIF